MRKQYPSDITREQFEQIRKDLSNARKTTHPRTYDLYDIFVPYAIMLTTAEVTDRNGAIEMVEYYCDVTDNLSQTKKLLADGSYTGTVFAYS